MGSVGDLIGRNVWLRISVVLLACLTGIPIVFVAAAVLLRSARVPPSVLVFVYLWIVAVSCILWRALEKRPLRDMWLTGNAVGGFSMGALAGAALIGVVWLALLSMRSLHVAWQSLAIIPLAAALASTFAQSSAEELLFRGYLLSALRDAKGPVVAVAFTSVVFAALHVVDVGLNPIALLNIAIWAVAVGLVALRFNSLWLAIGLHVGWNWAQWQLLGFSVYGNAADKAALATSVVSGSPLLTGGSAGPEGSLFVTVLLVGALFVLAYHPSAAQQADRADGARRRIMQRAHDESQ